MDIVTPVTFTEVRKAYRHDHPVERAHESNTNRDGEENLERADELLGRWWQVRLSRVDVLGVVLPWHLSDGGELELVPPSGLTVAGAVERIRSAGPRWAEANPVCTAKFELLGHAPFTPVFLSTRAVPHPHYAGLLVREGLIHLDGLHRMIAWELAGRLTAGERMDAYVAGDLGSPAPGEERA